MPLAGSRRRNPPPGSATAVASCGSASTPKALMTCSSASPGPKSESTARSAGSICTSAQNTILRR